MKQNVFLVRLLCVILSVLMLAGCGAPAAPAETTEATEATEPAPTIPPNGNPEDVTCLGSYTAGNTEVSSAADTHIASIGSVSLTLRQLQLYYWLEVASYRQSDAEVEPDYTQRLDTQTGTIPVELGASRGTCQRLISSQIMWCSSIPTW